VGYREEIQGAQFNQAGAKVQILTKVGRQEIPAKPPSST